MEESKVPAKQVLGPETDGTQVYRIEQVEGHAAYVYSDVKLFGTP